MAKKKMVNKKNININKQKQKIKIKQVVNVNVNLPKRRRNNKPSQPVNRPSQIQYNIPYPSPIFQNHIMKENDKPKVSLGNPIIPEIKETEILSPLDRFKIYGEKDKNLLAKMTQAQIDSDNNDEFSNLYVDTLKHDEETDLINKKVFSPSTDEIDDVFFQSDGNGRILNPLTNRWIQDTSQNRKRVLKDYKNR